MRCSDVGRLLSDADSGQVTPQERDHLATHLATCDACQDEWQADVATRDIGLAIRLLRGGGTVEHEVMARLEQLAEVGGEDTPPDANDPTAIGGFEVLGRLGQGGMGTVFRARQISMDRVVALKVLSERLARNREYVSRFIREARAAASLRHPHIVQAHDVGVADGYYYFAMEWVDGEGLDKVLARSGPMDQSRAVELMKQVCSALEAAHDAGIIHRDIKPSNIMVDRHGLARVTDFGLARRSSDNETLLTADGTILGTPAYVSAEMAAGKKIDCRSDLYSLGATFFHLLGGRPPFEGSSFFELISKHVNEQPPSLAEVAPRVDHRVCQIVDRLLAKDPDERYQSARAVRMALEALGPLVTPKADALPSLARADATTVVGPGQSPAGPRKRRLRRPLRLITLIALAAIVIGVVGAVLTRVGPWSGRDGGATAAEAREASAKEAWEGISRRAEGDMTRDGAVALLASLDKFLVDHAGTRVAAARREDALALRTRVQEAADGWRVLLRGTSLDGWTIVTQFPVDTPDWDGKAGLVRTDGDHVLLEPGQPLTGITWQGEFPPPPYEVKVEAKRVDGEDCFCALVFPVRGSHCLLEVGAEGGALVGLELVDGQKPQDTGVGRRMGFERGRWYRIRLRVTATRAQAWVDDEEVVDLALSGHTLSLASHWEPVKPFGVGVAVRTTGALRWLKVRRLSE